MHLGDGAQAARLPLVQLVPGKAPAPPAGGFSGVVHPALGAQAQNVLHLVDGPAGDGLRCGVDQLPVHLTTVGLQIDLCQCTLPIGSLGEPAQRGVVVVGAGVDDLVATQVVRQEDVLGIVQEGQLQHGHAGQAGVGQQLAQAVGLKPQVLGHQRQLAQRLFQGVEERHARAGRPFALACRGAGGRDSPVGVETAEVVDAHDVGQGQAAFDARDPPGVALFGVLGPAVQRVAPALAIHGEVVGRDAGHVRGPEILAQVEELGIGPGVGAVQRHEDGHVTHDADVVGVGVGADGLPLLLGHPLHEAPEQVVVAVVLADVLQGGRLALGVVGRPFLPGLALVEAVQHHEQGVVVQPGTLALAEVVELGAQRLMGVTQEGAGSLRQRAQAETLDTREVDAAFARGRARLAVDRVVFLEVGRQPALRGQAPQVHQHGVEGHAGRAHVRRIAAARRHQRQDLPQVLLGVLQPVDEVIGAGSEVSRTGVLDGERLFRADGLGIR